MAGLGHDGDRMIIHRMPPPSLVSFRSLETAACAFSLQGKAHLLSARRVFDAMPTTRVRADLNIGQVLSVTVHHMLYPITLSVLHQVFGAYGMVLKLSVVGKLVYCQVLVQYHTCESAAQAMKALQGRYIYDGCCRLDIKGAELSELSVLENSSSMLSKPPLVTNTPKQVPTFDGTNMNRWRTDCEEFFELNKIPRILWIIAAEMNMVGDAALWLQAYKSRHVSAAWEDLCAAMLQAFGPGTDQQLPDIAEDCQDIDENKILNVQSAPSQDSVCSQTQVSPVHCPISKMNEGELGLDSADEIFRERPFKDMVWDEELAESMVTHIGGSSLFLEQIMDTHQELEGDVDKRGNLQQLLSKEMQQHGTNSDTLVLPWDPGKQENGINGLFSWKLHADPGDLFFMIQLASKLQFKQWDPGVLRIFVAQMRNPRTAGTKDACDWTSWSRRYPCRGCRYCLLRPVQAIAWGQAMFRGGGNVIHAHGDIPGEVDMGRGPAGVGSSHGSLVI